MEAVKLYGSVHDSQTSVCALFGIVCLVSERSIDRRSRMGVSGGRGCKRQRESAVPRAIDPRNHPLGNHLLTTTTQEKHVLSSLFLYER